MKIEAMAKRGIPGRGGRAATMALTAELTSPGFTARQHAEYG